MHHVVETQGVKTELFSRPIIFTLMYLACSKSVRVQREKRNFKGTKRNVAYYLRDFVFLCCLISFSRVKEHRGTFDTFVGLLRGEEFGTVQSVYKDMRLCEVVR